MDYPTYITLTKLIEDGAYPLDCDNKFKKKLDRMAKAYQVIHGKLHKKSTLARGDPLEVLHQGNIDEVLIQIHKEGHFGVNNTWYKAKIQYYAPRLFSKVAEVVKYCESCQYRKKKPAKRVVVSKPITTPARPFYMVGIDYVGPVVESNRGNRGILVCVDYLTRWPIAKAVPNVNEETTASFIMEEIVSIFGVPQYMLSDRGSNFLSRFVESFLKQIQCRHLTTSAFRPNTNGLVERTNGTLVQALSKICKDELDDVKDWDLKLPAALMALRTMKNESTNYTPGKLLFGYDIRTPGNWTAPRIDYEEGNYASEINRRIQEIDTYLDEYRKKARQNSNEGKKKMKVKYDETVKFRELFKVGEQVLMKDQYPENKFADRWIGPMTVTKVNQSGTYYLVGPNSRRLDGVVNGDQLIAYHRKSRMTPDVQLKRKEGVFMAWLQRKESQYG
jgi:hypothetical protein